MLTITITDDYVTVTDPERRPVFECWHYELIWDLDTFLKLLRDAPDYQIIDNT